MLEDSGEFKHDPRETGLDTRSRRIEHELLLGQLVEAVKALRREQAEQTALLGELAKKVGRFENIAQGGRGILIGMGLASLGIGAVAHKLVEMLWPT